ncbi:peptidoglycan D,D-transpeptidase FtsI family protein [Corynebacterium nuruki]|uniref:peptidoglycan D,D-transpeptidase FtsI family protein n=1 Tax=Corynebacterium nuruki TaxID=1032851 RepID=UPI0039BFB833
MTSDRDRYRPTRPSRRTSEPDRSTNSWLQVDPSAGRFSWRGSAVIIVVIVCTVVLVARLVQLQVIEGPSLSAEASQQRTAVLADPAKRGAIVDDEGRELAYTMDARALSVHPKSLLPWMEERHELDPDDVAEPTERLEQIIREVPGMLGDGAQINPEDLRRKLTSDSTYEVLVRDVDPDKAEAVAKKFPEITAERQDVRQYPNGAVAANVIGKISRDNEGQFGLELSQDAKLQGIDGSRTVDIGGSGNVVPGSTRDEHPSVNGDTYHLTLDVDAQTYVQQATQQAKEKSGADSASVVVMDAKTGKIRAMATSDTINPQGDLDKQLDQGKEFGNRTVEAAYEPGSVAKVMTAAAAIQEGKTTPDEVLQVPGQIEMSGVTVKDAWEHGTVPYTTTGVFSKSSNVGTLMLASRVGQENYDKYLQKFGIGQSLDLGLPGETSGYVPDLNQWSGGTFANLPIGQGMSMNLVQMTGIYQAMANSGVRVQPTLIDKVTSADGTDIPQPEPATTEVVSPQTARTVVDMFRGINQDDPTGVQQGTAPAAAIQGYQTSGKTGTAQQIDPDTGAYSNSAYWITYAGMAPADDPRYVVGIMLDNPERSTDGTGGQSAAPLFHDVMSWLLDHYNVPLSPEAAPRMTLEAQ